jgi:hypothetical protein
MRNRRPQYGGSPNLSQWMQCGLCYIFAVSTGRAQLPPAPPPVGGLAPAPPPPQLLPSQLKHIRAGAVSPIEVGDVVNVSFAGDGYN